MISILGGLIKKYQYKGFEINKFYDDKRYHISYNNCYVDYEAYTLEEAKTIVNMFIAEDWIGE